MSNTKKSILLYLDNYPMLVALPPEQRGWVVTALLEYGGELCRDETVTPEAVMGRFPMSSEARLVFGFMGANIRRDNQRWLSRQRGQSTPRKGAAPDPDSEQKIREDMERARRILEQSKK